MEFLLEIVGDYTLLYIENYYGWRFIDSKHSLKTIEKL